MYLKSIEVQGFKSFANKILFQTYLVIIEPEYGQGRMRVGDFKYYTARNYKYAKQS